MNDKSADRFVSVTLHPVRRPRTSERWRWTFVDHRGRTIAQSGKPSRWDHVVTDLQHITGRNFVAITDHIDLPRALQPIRGWQFALIGPVGVQMLRVAIEDPTTQEGTP